MSWSAFSDSKKNAAHLGARGYFYYNIISVEVGQGMEQNEVNCRFWIIEMVYSTKFG